jgi:hypothetical protein
MHDKRRSKKTGVRANSFLGEFWVLEEEKSSSFLHSFFFINKLYTHIINKR